VSKVAKSLVLLGGSRGAPPIEGGEGDRDRGGSSQKCSEDTLQGWEGSSTTAALVGAAAGEGRWSLSLKGVARRKRRTDPSANPKATSPPSEDTEEALSELEEGGTNTCSRGRDRSVIENTFIVYELVVAEVVVEVPSFSDWDFESSPIDTIYSLF
jgi:hypothetical protein